MLTPMFVLAGGETSTKTQLFAIGIAVALCVGILELVRRKHLMERYAILWLGSAAVLLVLSVFKRLLNHFSDAIGIAYAPAALFVVVLGAVLAMLLHFSLVVSRLVVQTKVLAQRLAAAQGRLEDLEAQLAAERTERTPELVEPE